MSERFSVHTQTSFEISFYDKEFLELSLPDEPLKHVSPLSWEHINLTGIYSWDTEQQKPDGFKPLRLPGRLLRAA
ncbi:hypothetical protein [Agrobacterium vitis]|uniref:hypothetical protein n=1 Tax=Agrobacterium vitis TaxID=373 RepID=UPI0015743BFA|nr:hypothetical protein [Agrobacterium vitis]NSZ19998.1 transposase [Agrobacterium vitis]QZO07393.1 hypothetical protein K4831_26105 [Agrobacterium vitis]UJL90886.1 hypothetical protein AVF2S5_23115 [Agrobacterium vitis]